MFKIFKKKIGVIGYGNMGSAIAARLKSRYSVSIFDKDTVKTSGLVGVSVCRSLADLVTASDAIIIAVKPQDLEPVLNEIKDYIKDKLIISIAAGITTGYLERMIGTVRVIRAMPNIGAIIGRSISYICKGRYATNNDLRLSARLFDCIGMSLIFPETLMNAATAVGGSGPGFWGYLFDKQPSGEWERYKKDYFVPEMISAAISVGFDEKTAELTANSLTWACFMAVSVLNITPIELTRRVASKGGTTEAGLEVLGKGGTLTEAVQAAVKRARELARE